MIKSRFLQFRFLSDKIESLYLLFVLQPFSARQRVLRTKTDPSGKVARIVPAGSKCLYDFSVLVFFALQRRQPQAKLHPNCKLFVAECSVYLQDDLLNILSLLRMLDWSHLHWLKIVAIFIGLLSDVSQPLSTYFRMTLCTLGSSYSCFCFSYFFSEPATDGRNDLRTFDGGTGRWPVAGAALDVQGMLPGGGPARLRFGANVRRWEESFVSGSFSSSYFLLCASGKLCVSPIPALLGYARCQTQACARLELSRQIIDLEEAYEYSRCKD